MPQVRTSVKLRGHRERFLAEKLMSIHHLTHECSQQRPQSLYKPALRVVCISDTHNSWPSLPPGDLLIHAGDLTENGSFDEVQAGLQWLSSQPYEHKILVAGNHDVLLDPVFLTAHPERRYGDTRTRSDLDWGGVTYLEDDFTTLEFSGSHAHPRRTLTIFGTPRTPRYGVSAFQYAPPVYDDEPLPHLETLCQNIPRPDIIVTHGPPRLHLDTSGIHRAGCPLLAEAVARVRPRLVVFGHIHAAYGREDDVVLDAAQRAYEEILDGSAAGWGGVMWMAMCVVWARVSSVLCFDRWGPSQAATTFVNASVVGGPKNDLVNEAVVAEL